jgi:hypothetical protein
MVKRTMRVFKYNEYEDMEPRLITEQEIRAEYWPHWYGRMCKKFGKLEVDSKFTFEDCLNDWVIVNWAWEVKE